MPKSPLLYLFIVGLGAALISCGGTKSQAQSADSTGSESAERRTAAPFSADSAYQYIQQQVAFGVRTPGSEGHRATAAWIEQKLRQRAMQYAANFMNELYAKAGIVDNRYLFF